MKKIFKYTFGALFGVVAFTACTNEYEYDGVGEAENPNAAGVYFTENNKKSFEVEPGNEQFNLTLERTNTTEAQTVGISVVEDEAGVFEVPETVEFAAGEKTATLHITAPTAQEGGEYSLTVAIADNDRGIYAAGMQGYTINMAVQKWEKLGTGYWLDGIVASLYGVDPSFPYAVEVEKLITETGIRFRFYGPYSHVATDFDGIGYVGYVYNEEGDCDEEDHLFVIDVTSAGATLKPVAMGMDWGDGAFMTGTIVGNLSTSAGVITDTNTYPLGTYDEEAGVIIFPAKSLFVQEDKVYITSKPSYLYLSADAYIAANGEEEE